MVEHIIEAMVDAVLVIDAEGKITLANSAASHITGHARDALQGMPVNDILIDDSAGLRTVVRRRIEEGDIMRRDASWLLTKTGERVPVSVTGSAVLGEHNVLEGIVLVARDVREVRKLLADKEAEIVRRRAAEDELRNAKASIEDQLDQTRSQLMTAERRATLGTLAGGVGHELKNIAQVAEGHLEEVTAVANGTSDMFEVAPQLLREMRTIVDHIATHSKRLISLARPGPDRLDPINLNEIVEETVAMLAGAGKLRRLTIVRELAPEALIVTVNRTRIEQILVNLLVNAVDAIGKPPGTITIRTRSDAPASRVVCEVSDSGSGIPPDILEKIFVPFFTTKPEDRGTGLGLPVAREIVRNYGGELEVASEVGAGTTFTFSLPR